MDNNNSQIFNFKKHVLHFNFIDGVLLCRRAGDKKNQWIKKIHDAGSILGVEEDEESFYLSFANTEKNGQFMVIEKPHGKTRWSIPGRSYLNQLYEKFIFLIFADGNDVFYLLKVDKKSGGKLWHHPVHEGLYEYIIKRESVSLKYSDGSSENISMETGQHVK